MTLRSNPVHSVHLEAAASQSQQTNRIKKLPPLLVNQLAAGEVVTRPASVVKELIENAIDAGAKNIDIRITQGGMGIIEVADDGCGIHPDDMVMAVTRFATSKIADVAHLQGINTLGFRGEALAATAAVSRLTLKSSADQHGVGRELNVAGILEDTPALIPVVHPQGTTVTVKDLYFNVPARRGNLKSISTEYAHIEAVVKQLALVASDISITLWHNDKRRFYFEALPTDKGAQSATQLMYEQASVDNHSADAINDAAAIKSPIMQSILARLQAILPHLSSQAKRLDTAHLQPLSIDLEGLRSQSAMTAQDTSALSIYGLLMPSINTNTAMYASSGYKLIYINGRLVKDRRIAQSVRDSAPEGLQLGYVLFFNLPTAWLNLNVHPSKQCIKIQNLANIMAHLEVGVRDALQSWQKRQPKPEKQAYLSANTANTVNSANTTSAPQPLAVEPERHLDNTASMNGKFKEGYFHQSSYLESSYLGDTQRNGSIKQTQAYDSVCTAQSQKHQTGVHEPQVSYESNTPLSYRDNGYTEEAQILPRPTHQPDYPFYHCLHLLDSTDMEPIDPALIDAAMTAKIKAAYEQTEQNKEPTVVLLQKENALWLCFDYALLHVLYSSDEEYDEHYQKQDKLLQQLLNEYAQCHGINSKLAWLNQTLNNRLATSENMDKLAERQALIEQQAIATLSVQEVVGIMLNSGRLAATTINHKNKPR